MNILKQNICGKSFSKYAEDNLELWSSLIGTEIFHSSKGHGHVVNVLQRQDYIPLVEIKFVNNDEKLTFNSESFSKVETYISIERSLAVKIYEWEKIKEKEERERRELERQRALKEEEERKRRELERQRALKEEEERKKARERAKKENIIERCLKHRVHSFWHMTHRDNIHGILKNGILNYYDAHKMKAVLVDISDPDVQSLRDFRTEHFYGRRIHEYVPLYIRPRNPMLYVRRNFQNEICLIEVSPLVLQHNEYIIANGNAASHITEFFDSIEDIDKLPWDVLNGRFWPDFDDGKRKMCAEVLIFNKIDPKFIKNIHCSSSDTKLFLSTYYHSVLVSANLYF